MGGFVRKDAMQPEVYASTLPSNTRVVILGNLVNCGKHSADLKQNDKPTYPPSDEDEI